MSHEMLVALLPTLALAILAGTAAVYLFSRWYSNRVRGELVAAEKAFKLALREARIRPTQQVDELAVAWQGYRKFRIVRKIIEDAKRETASLYMAPIDGRRLPAFAPGAYLNLRVDIPDHGPETRSYSISAAFRRDYYRLSIKRVPEWTNAETGKTYPAGLVSNFVHDHVHEGSTVDIAAPQGCPDFVLSMEAEHPAVLLGGGVGITPMICMWEELVTRQPTRPTWLFYGVRGSAELMDNAGDESALKTMLEQASDVQRLWICFSRVMEVKDEAGTVVGMKGGESEGDRMMCDVFRRRMQAGEAPRVTYAPGRVSVKSWIWDALPERFQTDAHFYTCGPGPFMRAIREDLLEQGVPSRRIHFEEFDASSHDALTDVVETKCEVVFNNAGRTEAVEWEGWRRDLQRLAKSKGINIRGTCGVGACGDCETVLLSGQVQHTREPLPYEPTPGCVLPCVAVPHPDCDRLELQA